MHKIYRYLLCSFPFLNRWCNKTSSSCLPQEQSVKSKIFFFFSFTDRLPFMIAIVEAHKMIILEHQLRGCSGRNRYDRVLEVWNCTLYRSQLLKRFGILFFVKLLLTFLSVLRPVVVCKVSTFSFFIRVGCGQVHTHAWWRAQSQRGPLRTTTTKNKTKQEEGGGGKVLLAKVIPMWRQKQNRTET